MKKEKSAINKDLMYYLFTEFSNKHIQEGDIWKMAVSQLKNEEGFDKISPQCSPCHLLTNCSSSFNCDDCRKSYGLIRKIGLKEIKQSKPTQEELKDLWEKFQNQEEFEADAPPVDISDWKKVINYVSQISHNIPYYDDEKSDYFPLRTYCANVQCDREIPCEECYQAYQYMEEQLHIENSDLDLEKEQERVLNILKEACFNLKKKQNFSPKLKIELIFICEKYLFMRSRKGSRPVIGCNDLRCVGSCRTCKRIFAFIEEFKTILDKKEEIKTETQVREQVFDGYIRKTTSRIICDEIIISRVEEIPIDNENGEKCGEKCDRKCAERCNRTANISKNEKNGRMCLTLSNCRVVSLADLKIDSPSIIKEFPNFGTFVYIFHKLPEYGYWYLIPYQNNEPLFFIGNYRNYREIVENFGLDEENTKTNFNDKISNYLEYLKETKKKILLIEESPLLKNYEIIIKEDRRGY